MFALLLPEVIVQIMEILEVQRENQNTLDNTETLFHRWWKEFYSATISGDVQVKQYECLSLFPDIPSGML